MLNLTSITVDGVEDERILQKQLHSVTECVISEKRTRLKIEDFGLETAKWCKSADFSMKSADFYQYLSESTDFQQNWKNPHFSLNPQEDIRETIGFENLWISHKIPQISGWILV